MQARLCAVLALVAASATHADPYPTPEAYAAARADLTASMQRCARDADAPDFPYTARCKLAFAKRESLLRHVGLVERFGVTPSEFHLMTAEKVKESERLLSARLDVLGNAYASAATSAPAGQ